MVKKQEHGKSFMKMVKKNGEKEPFDRAKIKRGLAKACWKRPITEDDIEGVITTLETELYGSYESDVPSGILGARLMELLRLLDQIAYVRFASVYREFKDVQDFVEELEPILAESHRSQEAAKPSHSGNTARASGRT